MKPRPVNASLNNGYGITGTITITVIPAVGGTIVQATCFNPSGSDTVTQPRVVPESADLGEHLMATLVDLKMLCANRNAR